MDNDAVAFKFAHVNSCQSPSHIFTPEDHKTRVLGYVSFNMEEIWHGCAPPSTFLCNPPIFVPGNGTVVLLLMAHHSTADFGVFNTIDFSRMRRLQQTPRTQDSSIALSKVSRAQVRGKASVVPTVRFEEQSLTSFAGLMVFQQLFARLGLKHRLWKCFRQSVGQRGLRPPTSSCCCWWCTCCWGIGSFVTRGTTETTRWSSGCWG